jgi:hypothetical protein
MWLSDVAFKVSSAYEQWTDKWDHRSKKKKPWIDVRSVMLAESSRVPLTDKYLPEININPMDCMVHYVSENDQDDQVTGNECLVMMM